MKKFNSTLVSNSKGFTLLEILIAIVLLAFVVIGVVNVTENAFQTKERTTEINKNNLQIETAMSRFEWDFSQIYSPLYFSRVMNLNQNVNTFSNTEGAQGGNQGAIQGGAQGTAQSGFNPNLQQYYEQLITRFERNEHFQSVSQEGIPIPRFYSPDKTVFEFFTSSNRRKTENTKQSHFAWVRYALADQEPAPDDAETAVTLPPGLKSFVRYFSADDPYSDKRLNIEDADRVKGAVLLKNVESLEFQFWDFKRRKWENSLKSIQDGENLIRGVRILLSWYDSQGHKRTTTRIFRSHWPMVTPEDTTTAQTPTTADTQGTGGTNGASTEGSEF